EDPGEVKPSLHSSEPGAAVGAPSLQIPGGSAERKGCGLVLRQRRGKDEGLRPGFGRRRGEHPRKGGGLPEFVARGFLRRGKSRHRRRESDRERKSLHARPPWLAKPGTRSPVTDRNDRRPQDRKSVV